MTPMGQRLNAIDPDLKALKDHGGKLILYHGWSDPALVPTATVSYYENVVAKMGPKDTASFVRLYMVPGGHEPLRLRAWTQQLRAGTRSAAPTPASACSRRSNAGWRRAPRPTRSSPRNTRWTATSPVASHAPAHYAPIHRWRATKDWALPTKLPTLRVLRLSKNSGVTSANSTTNSPPIGSRCYL